MAAAEELLLLDELDELELVDSEALDSARLELDELDSEALATEELDSDELDTDELDTEELDTEELASLETLDRLLWLSELPALLDTKELALADDSTLELELELELERLELEELDDRVELDALDCETTLLELDCPAALDWLSSLLKLSIWPEPAPPQPDNTNKMAAARGAPGRRRPNRVSLIGFIGGSFSKHRDKSQC